MADLTPDLHIFLLWGLIAKSFHSLQYLSVSCVPVILGLPGPRFPSTCMWKAVLTAPLELSTCPYHRSLLSFRMRSRSSMPSYASSSLDLVVTMSWGLTLQICLIIALIFLCRRWRFGFVNDQVSLAWSIALCTQSTKYLQSYALLKISVNFLFLQHFTSDQSETSFILRPWCRGYSLPNISRVMPLWKFL